MLNKRWSLIIGSMLLASVGASGCTETEDSSGGSQGGSAVKCETKADCDKAECKSKDLCKEEGGEAGACTESDCDKEECKSDPVCNNGGSEQIDPSKACEANHPEMLDDKGDADNDGITNVVEKKNGLNPCNPDTDGDGILDGEEDLNHNGLFEEQYGETNAAVPDANVDPEELNMKKSACDMSRFNVTSETYNSFSHAKFNNATYRKSKGGDAVAFESDIGVFGVFVASNKAVKGNMMMKMAFGGKSYSPFVVDPVVSVPSAKWDSVIATNPDTNLVVPKHEITRIKYQFDEVNTPMAQIVEKISSVLGQDFDPSGNTKSCPDQTLIYFTSAQYGEQYLYSIAVVCAGDVAKSDVNAMLDDVFSGTLVAPGTKYVASPNRFFCQTTKVGQLAGAVDFIWVIDNSGSMADEQNNLSKTVEGFMKRLQESGIDYHIGVTSTDAYLLDEWPDYYKADEVGADGKYANPTYYETTGLINGFDESNSSMSTYHKGLDDANSLNNSTFMAKISKRDSCMKPIDFTGYQDSTKNTMKSDLGLTFSGDNGVIPTFNICGFGYEDGLRSGVVALSRLNAKSGDLFELKRRFICESDSDCPDLNTYGMLRDDALKYVLFVSDEESRQFKEANANVVNANSGSDYLNGMQGFYLSDEGVYLSDKLISNSTDHQAGIITNGNPEVSDKGNACHYDPNHNNSGGWDCMARPLFGCRTGYQLSDVTMQQGKWNHNILCQDTSEMISSALANGSQIDENSSLEEIQSKAPKYYAMLNYYLEQYRQFGGNAGITAFALVGDAGVSKDGICKPLMKCKGGCIINGQPMDGINYECDECTEGFESSSSAVVGADYGLSYIHMAKYLNKDRGGKYASMCGTNFDNTINAIFEDVQSRVSQKYLLKGYPIASTIRVYVTDASGSARELKRGDRTNSWDYDESENAITLTGMDNSVKNDGYIAFSYVIWGISGV